MPKKKRKYQGRFAALLAHQLTKHKIKASEIQSLSWVSQGYVSRWKQKDLLPVADEAKLTELAPLLKITAEKIIEAVMADHAEAEGVLQYYERKIANVSRDLTQPERLLLSVFLENKVLPTKFFVMGIHEMLEVSASSSVGDELDDFTQMTAAFTMLKPETQAMTLTAMKDVAVLAFRAQQHSGSDFKADALKAWEQKMQSIEEERNE